MMRRILVGFMWFIVLWVGISLIGGMIAGIFVAGRTPGDTKQVEAAAGDFVHKFSHVIMLGSAVLAVVGTAMGVLPGTRRTRQRQKEATDMTSASIVQRRPLVLTLFCIATFLYYCGMFLLLLVPKEWHYMVQIHGTTELLLTALSFSLIIVGSVGYWTMRKWGICLTFVALAIHVLVDVVHHQSVGGTNTWWEVALVGSGLAYLRRMS